MLAGCARSRAPCGSGRRHLPPSRAPRRATVRAMTRIAVLGAGKIGEALLAGLLAAGQPAGELVLHRAPSGTGPRADGAPRRRRRRRRRGGRAREVLVVAVKPQDIDPLLAELATAVRPGTLVVSLCAGLPTSLYEQVLPAGTPVVRVMPNTPMLVGEAMSAVSGGSHATDEHLAAVEKMLGSVGPGGAAAGEPAGRGDGAVGLRACVLLLPRRGHDRRGDPAGPAARGGGRADRAVGLRRGGDDARVRRPPRDPPRGRDLAGRARRSPRCASSSATGCARRCWRRSKRRATGRWSWARADAPRWRRARTPSVNGAPAAARARAPDGVRQHPVRLRLRHRARLARPRCRCDQEAVIRCDRNGPTPTDLPQVQFLTVAEVAARMRVSKMTVYRLVHGGELPAARVGRSFRVSAPRRREPPARRLVRRGLTVRGIPGGHSGHLRTGGIPADGAGARTVGRRR